MPAPTSYTEKTLADYLNGATVLGAAAAELGWTVGASDAGSYQEIVWDALLIYGGASQTISAATNIPLLRAIARYCAWKAVTQATVPQYSFSGDGQQFSRHQFLQNAHRALDVAISDALALGAQLPENTLVVGQITYPEDPYGAQRDQRRHYVLPTADPDYDAPL